MISQNVYHSIFVTGDKCLFLQSFRTSSEAIIFFNNPFYLSQSEFVSYQVTAAPYSVLKCIAAATINITGGFKIHLNIHTKVNVCLNSNIRFPTHTFYLRRKLSYILRINSDFSSEIYNM